MKTIALIILFLTVMACSQKTDVLGVKVGEDYYALDHDSKQTVVNKNSDETLVCRSIRKVGSHFKAKRCTTKSKLERDRKDATDYLDKNQIYLTRKWLDSGKGG